MNIILTLIKHLWPTTWFTSISKEAEHAPATVIGIFGIWFTIIALSTTAYVRYAADAKAEEAKFAEMTETMAKNTIALDCSRRDRLISAKTRDIANLTRLLERAADNAEKRELDIQLTGLERELSNLELGYEAKCLNGT